MPSRTPVRLSLPMFLMVMATARVAPTYTLPKSSVSFSTSGVPARLTSISGANNTSRVGQRVVPSMRSSIRSRIRMEYGSGSSSESSPSSTSPRLFRITQKCLPSDRCLPTALVPGRDPVCVAFGGVPLTAAPEVML